jgi:hypothetical protein
MATTWQDLYGLNPQLRSGNPNLIYPGEVLNLPDGSTYTIVPGDTLSSIAARQPATEEPPTTPVEEEQEGENETTDDSGEEAEAENEITITASRNVDYRALAKPNPLSAFSSYTYGLTMYMVTPEAFNNFVKKGGTLTNIKGKSSGVFVIAQSGGINSDVEDRAITYSKTPGKGGGPDYFIDELEIGTVLPGGSNKSTTTTDIKFKITEQYGFNFLRDLSQAADACNKMSEFTKKIDPKKQPNAVVQHYIMGIKFYGYDKNGKILSADSPEVIGYDNGDGVDPNAVIQRYYAFNISDMKFTLNGKSPVYNMEGFIVQELAAFGEINSTINKSMELEGATVADAMIGPRGILTIINSDNEGQKDREKIGVPNVLAVEFYDESGKLVDPEESEIARGKMVDDETFAAETAPPSNAKKTSESTVAGSYKAVSIDKKSRVMKISNGTNIMTVLENLIIKSSYIGDALAATKSAVAGENRVIKKAPTKKLTWFSIIPVAEVIGRDEKTNTWAYKITYQIRPFSIPYLKTTVGSSVSKYPGPSKFYDYWLTGRNSEIISYTQQYDSLLFMPQGQSQNTDAPQKEVKDGTPVGTRNAVLASKVAAATNRASEFNDTVAAQLYSPADNATAKMKIIGDPDYLMSAVSNPRIAANKLYSGDGSIDGRTSQVFAQISFATASDYEPNGLLNVDDNIQFYKTDKVKNLGIDGIVYRVVEVSSVFSRGKFEQNIDMVMVSENELVGEETQPAGGERAESNDSGGTGSTSANKNKQTVSKGSKIRSAAHDKLNANPPTGQVEEVNNDVRQLPDYDEFGTDRNQDPEPQAPEEDPEEENNSEQDFGSLRVVGDDALPGDGGWYDDGEYEA